MGEAALRRSARPRRTGKIIAIAGSGILAAAALATALITRGGVVRDTPATGQLPPSTAQMARQTLRDTTDLSGLIALRQLASLSFVGRPRALVRILKLAVLEGVFDWPAVHDQISRSADDRTR
ncbi:hypothetical protein ACIBHX_44170 [Nonomuraea sp. NPDC050536]|uniref:hypothetical protein n=1 Tax=Nonomuraea sp. NPDC050536 TaxID=3364366 RepID=UPI0037C5A5E7